MSHTGMSVPIPDILEIGHGALQTLSGHCIKNRFLKVGVLFDAFSKELLKDRISSDFASDGITITSVELTGNEDIHVLISEAFRLDRFDCLIAAGGGAVIDAGKYMAFSRRVPFISIPTSPSNDGFASSNCSLMVDNKKTTVPAAIPYGVIADLEIIEHAPISMILAGTGDLMSNITAMHDWYYEEKEGVASVHAFAAMLSKKGVNSFIRTPMEDIRNRLFLKELISSMTMGGIATMISGNSSPISGSEHMISHALDQTAENPLIHGLQVGLASYLMSLVHDYRYERMRKVFLRTGFFDHIKTLNLNRAEWENAIDLAPQMKPKRLTYLHKKEYREQAKAFLHSDQILNTCFREN